MTIRFSFLLAILVALSASSAWAAMGRTPSQFAISATGGAQYSIPIWTPPGIRGVQPHLTLSYNSQSSYGLMGPGWTLGGLSSIARCNPTYAQDGTPAPITLTTADGLCLDGNRLRSTGTGTYQTEIANFSQVTASGTAGNGPMYFTVRGKDGLIYEYGNTTDSRVLPPAGTTPYIWALDKITDRSGNHMTFTYYQAGGSYVPLSIQYTAPSGPTAFPYQVNFAYTTKSANDTISQFIAGSQIQQTQQLGAITVTSSGTTVRKYNLSYTTSSTTLRATLTSIQECGGSAGTDCLTATAVGYQYGTAGVASPTTASGSGTTNGTVYSVDIDGDGKQDLVFAVTSGSNYQWWVQLATASGYGNPIAIGVSTIGTRTFLLDDFDGSGTTQILAATSGVWVIYKWNAASQAFSQFPTGVPVVSTDLYSTADIDGDGKADLVELSTGASTVDYAPLQLRLSTSGGGSFSFAAAVAQSPVVGGCCGANVRMYGNNQAPASSVRHLDFDGDGRQDILLAFANRASHSGPSTAVVPLLMRGTAMPIEGYSTQVSGAVSVAVLPLNWNDDACTDYLFNTAIYLTPCNGSAPAGSAGAAATIAMDWDGDGRTDLLANVSGVWQLYRSEGNAVAPVVSTGIPAGSGTWAVTDKDGDGLNDLLFANSAASNAVYYGVHNGAGVQPDLATSFIDGYGVAFRPTYITLSAASHDVYAKGSAQVFPQQDYDGPLEVVSSYTASDGVGATYSINYYYTIGVMNLQGRGFAGFQSYKSHDSRTQFWTFYDYSTDFPTTGLYTHLITTQNDTSKAVHGLDYNIYHTLTLDSTPNNQRYFPFYSQITENTSELRGALDAQLITKALTAYGTPDIYGNFPSVVTTVTDEDTTSPYYNDQWTTTTATSVTPDSSANWCLNLPTEVDVTSTAPGVPAITRHTSYTPDYSYCRETQQVIEPSSTVYKVTTAIGYDSFGNVNSQSVTGIGMAARTTGVNWGTLGQFPTIITNPLSQQSHKAFDQSSGKQLTETDPNGNITSWQYDSFARKINETRPDGTSTTWDYNNCLTAGCVNSNNRMTVVQKNLNVNGSTLNISNTYLDWFDRVLVTSKQLVDGTYDENEVQYDNRGNVKQSAAPCIYGSCTTPYWTVNTYDALNRLTQTQRPISASNSTLQTTTIGYAGRSATTTDPQSKMTTTITKVTGSLGRTKDHNGYYINFNHDAFGSLLSVTDSLSNTLRSMTYDYGLGAFPRTLNDMDLGTRSYTVDALGEMTAYSDGKSQSFSVLYDPLSRPTSRTEPDLTTTWGWGMSAASHNIGKLATISSASLAGTYSHAYAFDASGRLTSEMITEPAVGAMTFDYSYDANTGLLNLLQYPTSYPSGYRVQAGVAYQYGVLHHIYDYANTATLWWRVDGVNPAGQIIHESMQYAAGDPLVVQLHTYDAVTGWVSGIRSGANGGSELQNESYLYDEMGNVTQRQNSNSTLGLTENFFYDNLYRLDHSTLGSTTNLQMHYDAMGNITSRSDVAAGATWTYDATHKHRVTQAGSISYTYSFDANGNAVTRNGVTIGWTSYNYPSSVGTSTESASFDYGPDRQRWRMTYNGPSGTETTYYANGIFERVATSAGTYYRHYIYANGRPVVVISRTTAGAINARSLLADNQGSISSIVTSATATNLVSESFTAYGNRRSAVTWTGTPTSTERSMMDGVTREGYTFQTVLGSMGLNHMNGRVQDAITGRFLSPDLEVPQVANTQSYNRYSYVNNNPLSFTDPSGYDPISDGITVVGYAGGPENPYADAAGVVVAVAEVFGLGGLFGGGGPTLSPSQQAFVSHGGNLNAPLPQITVTGSSGSFASTSSYSIATQFYSPFTTSAVASVLGTEPSQVTTRVTTTPSQSPDELDQINVYATGSHGFDWWNLAPGWAALNCWYYGCGAGNWTLAVMGAIPGGALESGAAEGLAPLARGGASLGNIAANDALRIQNAANRIGQQISLVGSRAGGTATAASDWDYVINGSSKALNSVSSSLPGAGNVTQGLFKNLDIFRGAIDESLPSITFFPEGP